MTTAETARDLGAYFQRCKGTDWFYQMADDQRAYKRGELACAARAIEATTPEKAEIMVAWQVAAHSRMPYKREDEWVMDPIAADFGLGEADLEA